MLTARIKVERGHHYEIGYAPDGTVRRVSVLTRPAGAATRIPRTTWDAGSGKPVPASAALAIKTWREQAGTEPEDDTEAAAAPPQP